MHVAKTLIATLLIGFACGSRLGGVAQSVSDVSVTRDICYATVAGRPLHLDLFRRASSAGPLPVVVCIHGGGWGAGNKSDMTDMASGLAKLGYCESPRKRGQREAHGRISC